MGNPDAVAREITEELAKSRIKLVASLPDNWINKLLDLIEADERFSLDHGLGEVLRFAQCRGIVQTTLAWSITLSTTWEENCTAQIGILSPRPRMLS